MDQITITEESSLIRICDALDFIYRRVDEIAAPDVAARNHWRMDQFASASEGIAEATRALRVVHHPAFQPEDQTG